MSIAVAMLVLLYVCLSVASRSCTVSLQHGAAPVLLSFRMVVTERSLNNSSGGGTGRRTGHVRALTPPVLTPCRTLAVRTNWQARKHSGMSCECERLATATVLWKSLTWD